VHIPWPARQYERTCADCGYCWRVPRQLARHVNPPRLSHTGGGRGVPGIGYVDAHDAQAFDKRAEESEAYRTCAKCSSHHYSQRPVRS